MRLARPRRFPERDSNEAVCHANGYSAVSAWIPRIGFAAARHVSAFTLRNRRSGTGSVFLDRSPPWRGPAMVAGTTGRSNRLWKLALSVPLVVCRQRPARQSPRVDFRGATAPERLRSSVRHTGDRLRHGHPFQTSPPSEGLGKLQSG